MKKLSDVPKPTNTVLVPCLSERSEESGDPGSFANRSGRQDEVNVCMFYVYILTNKSNKVLYTGVTNNLERRLYEHKNNLIKGFTQKYNVNKLVYYETTSDVRNAIMREKQIKGWLRSKKIELVVNMNPEWKDLSECLDE